MSKPRLVLVGNGMAGVRTLEELLKRAPGRYDITVFGAEPHPNYNRILLSPVLAGEQQLDEIVLHPRAWYAAQGITLHLGQAVVAVDRERRCVRSADGRDTPYDLLLLATGSRPFIPPLPGRDLLGVQGYRDMADTLAMMEAASQHRQAVVIGGGLLGLEAACGLAQRGMQVTVVHLGERLLDRQLDAHAAGLLCQTLQARGLDFRLGASTEALLGDEQGRVRAVQLRSGELLPAQLVVVAAGVRPHTALAEQAGLACERGIVVDDQLRSVSDARIYAVGECANHRGVAYGLVAPLYEQAQVCARHLAGDEAAAYAGSVVSAKLKVTGIDLFSAGDVWGDAHSDTLLLSDPGAGLYKKLVLRQDRLVGICLYGEVADGSTYLQLLREGTELSAQREQLLFDPRSASPSACLT